MTCHPGAGTGLSLLAKCRAALTMHTHCTHSRSEDDTSLSVSSKLLPEETVRVMQRVAFAKKVSTTGCIRQGGNPDCQERCEDCRSQSTLGCFTLNVIRYVDLGNVSRYTL